MYILLWTGLALLWIALSALVLQGTDAWLGPPAQEEKSAMKTVRITLRSTTSRVPFRSGTYRAMLEDESAQGYAVLGTTRAYPTWGKAAGAALRLADRHGYFVVNRELVESRIATEMPRHVADGGPGNKSE